MVFFIFYFDVFGATVEVREWLVFVFMLMLMVAFCSGAWPAPHSDAAGIRRLGAEARVRVFQSGQGAEADGKFGKWDC